MYRLWLIVVIALFSCSSRTSQEEVEVLSKVSVVSGIDNEKPIESIDIASKLASGENFRLPAISGCNYGNDGEAFEILVTAPSSRQLIQISEILKYSGLPANFKILKTVNSIDNAFAAIFEGQRVIVFDEDLLGEVDDRGSQEYWASMSILAHEIGHHLSGHTLDGKGSNHTSEMEADKFSGYVLFKMGADIEDATYAMDQIGSDFDSPSHPSRMKRVEYIKDGWIEANRQRMMAALPPPPADEFEDENFRVYADQILDNDLYEWLYIDRSGEYTLIERNEGIILKREKSSNMFFYEIKIISMVEDHEYLTPGEVYTFGMDNPINAFNPMHHLKRGAFTEIVMQPGRKIRFTLSAQGNQGGFIITKVEVIPRVDG